MPTADAFLRSGKVRDLYALDDGRLLLVASDRISAFDVVLPTDDPRQGPGPDRPVALLVRRDRRDRPEPPARRRRPASDLPAETRRATRTLPRAARPDR